MVLERLLLSIQTRSFLEWTGTSFEHSFAEFYIILFQDVGGGNLFLTLVSKTDNNGSMVLEILTVLAGEDAEVHLHALQTMTEQFQLCEWGHCRGKLHRCSEITSGSWAAPDYPTCPHTPLH
jgi:hypothetical protein